MRRLLFILLMLPSFLCAQQEFFPEDVVKGDFIDESLCHPFSLISFGLRTDAAPFYSPDVRGENISFANITASGTYAHPLTACSGVVFGAQYVGTDVAWRENPSFKTTHFSYLGFTLGAYTLELDRWSWKATFSALFDTAVLDLSNYALYDALIIGEYSLPCGLYLNVGFMLELGLCKEKAWPVFGFRYDASPLWRLHLIYPIDISLEYLLTPTVTFAGAIRFLRDRHRVLDTEPAPMSIYNYETLGAEATLIFRPLYTLELKGFAGSTFRGDFTISDRNNHHGIHYKFRPTFYAGGGASLKF